MSCPMESVKEVVFGGAVGLCAGLAAKRVGLGLVGGIATTVFIVFRAAIFDGIISAKWSPLLLDDGSLKGQLKRKARREAFSATKRTDLFLRDNILVFTGYGCAFVAGTAI